MAKLSPYLVEIDKATQVLALDIPEDSGLGEAELLARPPLFARRMMPASLVAQKAKMFDDGLMAAVELAADRGCGRLRGKSALLRRWQTLAQSEALALALELRAGQADIPIGDTPISFYTWNTHLERIFASDRRLQRRLEPPEAAQLWSALGSCGGREEYAALQKLSARLTNPLTDNTLGNGGEQAMFPASASTEQRLREGLGTQL